jgi:glycosyltransferase involved in cell wall biosynthesis
MAVVNWTDRHVGGAETYLSQVLPALRETNDVFFWHEGREPADRQPLAGVADLPSCSPVATGVDAAIRTLKAWRPDVLYVHGLRSPDLERSLLAVAPAVFFAHSYYGTCITGAKAVHFPVVQPCDRHFGPACLLHFYPHRCGGLSPITMAVEYKRQAARLDNLRKYSTIGTFSAHMRREYLKHGFSDDRVRHLPAIEPMPTADAKLDRLRQTAAGASEVTPTWRLSFVGRTDVIKGCRVLLEALPAVRSGVTGRIVLTIAGDGPDMAACRAVAEGMASRLPDTSVVFLGWVSHEQCEAVLDESDVLVLPSLLPEPLGLSGLEALRRGVPVAAFAVGGIPEWLEDGKTGALAPGTPPTSAGLASAIVRCLTTAAIQEGARATARRVGGSIQQHLASLLPVLEAAASHPS